MSLRSSIKQNPVASFIVLTVALYGVSFVLPVPKEGAEASAILMDLFVPTVSALLLVMVTEGRQSLGAFLRQSFRWRGVLTWYVIALVIGFLIPLGSSVLALLAGRIPSIEFSAPTGIFVLYPVFALLEDIGWRGFALRRLLDRLSPFTATLIVGIPWALMHFSLGVVFEPEVAPLSWGLSVFAAAFLITWVFVRSGRNVLAAAVLHATFNVFAGIATAAIPSAETLWFVSASAWIGVAVLIGIDWRMWFARPSEMSAGEAVRSVTESDGWPNGKDGITVS